MKRRRLKHAGAVVGLVAGLGLACQERLAGPDDPEGTRWCSPLTGAYIVDEEGEIIDAITGDDDGTLFVCRCIPYEEGIDRVWNDEVNDEALELCLARAAEMGYPDPEDHTCHERHEMNAWADNFHILVEDRDKSCELDAETPTGCSVVD